MSDNGYKPFLPATLLQQTGDEERGTFNHDFKNFSLKTGVILKAIDIEDENNVSKTAVEYDVSIYEQDEDRGVTQTIYKNCTFIDSFGGIADFMEVRRRTPENQEFKSDLNVDRYNGSMVLLLCIDGVSEKGIIIGAISHPKRTTTLTKDAGMHLEGEFNGLNWQVNKDGELTVTFKSASDNDGQYEDEEAGGTFAKLEKDGSIELSDAKTESIRIDKTNETIDIKAAKDISNTTDANFKIVAKENVGIKTEADLLVAATGKADIEAKSMIDVKTEGMLQTKAMNYFIQADNDFSMLTNTFLMQGNQAIFLNTQTLIGPVPQPALIFKTQFRGIGNLGGPVVSSGIGPYSTSVLISE